MLALTSGDPSGIGPEIALRAWQARRGVPRFFLIGDPELMAARANLLGLEVPVVAATPQSAAHHFESALPVVPLNAGFIDKPGEPVAENAAGIIESIDRAVTLTMAGEARAVVTCPIAKKPLYEAGFKFPGHTEYLAHLAGDVPVVMMLASTTVTPPCRVVPVTIHIALRDVPAALTPELLEQAIRITGAALQRDFGITRPRIAVAGLNPHAGENGVMGDEEARWIAPLLARLRGDGFDLAGPLPADTMFHAAARARYDAALCAYHDQALIPIKTLDFAGGVNVTLGLPFIRTSPDHGTGFDIAGKGIARADSFIAAVRLASEMASARANR